MSVRFITKHEYDEALSQRVRDRLHRESLTALMYSYEYNIKMNERRIYEAVVRYRKKVRRSHQER